MKSNVVLFLLLFFPFLVFAQTWEALNKEVMELYDKEEFEKAIPLAIKALEEAKIEFGKKEEYGISLYNLANLYRNIDQLPKAASLLEECISILKNILKEDNSDYLRCLNNLGQVYWSMNEFKKAESVCIDINLILQKKADTNPFDYVRGLSNIAVLYKDMGDFENVEKNYRAAADAYLKSYHQKDSNYARIIIPLANFYRETDQFAKSEVLFLEIREIIFTTFGKENIEYATCLNNLGLLYIQMDKYEEAEAILTQSLLLKEKLIGKLDPNYVITVHNLGLLYSNTADYIKSEQFYLESLDLMKQSYGDSSREYAISLYSFAELCKKLGQYTRAESLLIQSRNIFLNNNEIDTDGYAGATDNLGNLYMDMGSYAKAEKYMLEAMEIRKRMFGEDHPNYGVSLNSLGSLYSEIGQMDKAQKMYARASEIIKNSIGENNLRFATSLNNLAVVADDDEVAELAYREAMKITKNIIGENNPDYINKLGNLSSIYRKNKNFLEAEKTSLQAKAISEKVFGKMHADYALRCEELGAIYLKMGRYKDAELIYKEALSISKKVMDENSLEFANCLYSLADLYSTTGDNKKAADFLILHNRIVFNMTINTAAVLSEKEKLNLIEDNIFYFQWANALNFNQGIKQSAENITNYNQLLLLKSLSLTDSRKMLDFVQHSTDTGLKKNYNDWLAGKSILAKQLLLPVDMRSKNIDEIEAHTEKLEKELSRRSSDFRAMQPNLQITLKEIQKALSNEEAAIEFVSFPFLDKGEPIDSIIYAAYVLLKNDSVPFFVPLFGERELEKIVYKAGSTTTAMVNNLYRGNTKLDKSAYLGKELYNLLWLPLEPYLKGIKKISYSPAGKLYGIAFHAIPVDSSVLLMDKYNLRQYTSTRQVALRNQETNTTIPSNIILFGNARFTMDSLQIKNINKGFNEENNSTVLSTVKNRGSDNGAWTNLPGTGEEINAIRKLFLENKIDSKSFEQETASEENLKMLSGSSCQVLHIATHGFFLPEPETQPKAKDFVTQNKYTLAQDPLLRSGLILAGGNYAWSGKTMIENVEDGIATSYEISQLNLSNTELVVLSACETALGDVKISEGVFGLQRAFKMAGVKKMIVSLWQVPDKETAELMTDFYTYWMKGKTIEESFNQAREDMKKKYAPFYWAAFDMLE